MKTRRRIDDFFRYVNSNGQPGAFPFASVVRWEAESETRVAIFLDGDTVIRLPVAEFERFLAEFGKVRG